MEFRVAITCTTSPDAAFRAGRALREAEVTVSSPPRSLRTPDAPDNAWHDSPRLEAIVDAEDADRAAKRIRGIVGPDCTVASVEAVMPTFAIGIDGEIDTARRDALLNMDGIARHSEGLEDAEDIGYGLVVLCQAETEYGAIELVSAALGVSRDRVSVVDPTA
jgi:hypothetical protein